MLALMMFVSCEQEKDEQQLQQLVKFNVSASGWQVTTRVLAADGQDMTDLWLFDYMDGELVNTMHQASTDDDFGTPTISMKNGTHTIYLVASRGKSPAINGTIIEWQQPSDTFWKAVTLNVTPSTTESEAVLGRVATRMRVIVTDEVPEGTAQLVITPDIWLYGFNYLTGTATSEQHTERTISIPSSYIGTSGQLVASIFGLSDDAEWMTNVSITAKNGDGNSIGTVALANVPFLRNRTTEVSGSLFGSNTNFSVSLNDVWQQSYTLGW